MTIKRFSQFLFATLTLGSMIALPALSAQASPAPSNLDQSSQAEENNYREGDAPGVSCNAFECVCPKGQIRECSLDANGRLTCRCKVVISS